MVCNHVRWVALGLLGAMPVLLGAGEPATVPATAPAEVLPAVPETAKDAAWKLIFHDEFDGKDLDTKVWNTPEYKRRDAHWTKKAVTLDGQGHLALKVYKEGEEFYDGCARTKGVFQHAFGYFVARMKMQNSAGHWPAFWLMCDAEGKVGNEGRDGSEIDIMEKPWLDGRVNHAIHWDGYGKDHKSEGHVSKTAGIMEGWHTFGLLWLPEEYVFYIDGKEVWRTKAGGVCQVPVYIKFSDETDFKGWAGDVRKAQVPDECLVDYVRVYDLVDRASGQARYPVPEGSLGGKTPSE